LKINFKKEKNKLFIKKLLIKKLVNTILFKVINLYTYEMKYKNIKNAGK